MKAVLVSSQSSDFASGHAPRETQNQGLWQQQLENVSLWKTNLAITAFKSKNPFLSPTSQKRMPSEANHLQPNQLTTSENKVVSELEPGQTENPGQLKQVVADALHTRSGSQPTAGNYGVMNDQYIGKTSITPNKNNVAELSHKVQSIPTNEVEWQKKHILTSDIDGVKQVWIRDSTITRSMSSKLTSTLLATMSQLGIELSRVTVNGQLVFENNHGVKE